MERKTGMAASIITLFGVICFAVSMLVGIDNMSYMGSIIIALGFVIMMCSFNTFGKKHSLTAGHVAIAFGAMYAVLVILVYFTQLTTIRNEVLSADAIKVLDYQNFGLFFNYDLLAYCFMAIATFFAGLTIQIKDRGDKWLKALLMVHGIFALSCFIMPILGVFSGGGEGSDLIGILVLEFWCVYFIPVCILAYRYFKRFDF